MREAGASRYNVLFALLDTCARYGFNLLSAQSATPIAAGREPVYHCYVLKNPVKARLFDDW